MANNISFEITDDRAIRGLENMTPDKLEKTVRRATTAAASIIRAQARKELQAAIGKGKAGSTRATRKFGGAFIRRKGLVVGVRSLQDKIRMKWHPSDSNTKVNIMYPILRWINNGTKERYRKNAGQVKYKRPPGVRPGYSGRVTADDWFGRAISAKKDEAFDRMTSVINASLTAAFLLQDR